MRGAGRRKKREAMNFTNHCGLFTNAIKPVTYLMLALVATLDY